MSVTTGKTETGKGWRVKQIQKSALGEALLKMIIDTLIDNFETSIFISEATTADQSGFGVLQPLLQTFFPAWQTVWTLPEQEFQDGTYTFKVSLDDVWRRIASSADAVLDELAMTILGSYDFDTDHLYQFSYKNPRGMMCRISHPDCEDPPFTPEVKVGALSLLPGQAMTFWYDFGDNWKFKVELESITPPDPKLTAPKLLKRHGKAPQQYGDDEWD
jgi:hypothetical protein